MCKNGITAEQYSLGNIAAEPEEDKRKRNVKRPLYRQGQLLCVHVVFLISFHVVVVIVIKRVYIGNVCRSDHPQS